MEETANAHYWILLVLSLALATACAPEPLQRVSAEQGVADLSHWDPTRGPIRVGGSWDFAWQALIAPDQEMPSDTLQMPVPGRWSAPQDSPAQDSTGFATYRVELMLPAAPSPQLALELRSIAGASQIWVDDLALPPSGHVDSDLPSVVEDTRRRSAVFTPTSGRARVTVQVANQRHQASGIRRDLLVSTPQAMETLHSWRTIGDTLITGVLFTMGLMFLVLARIRPADTHHAWFAGLCFVFGLRETMVGQSQLITQVVPGLFSFPTRLRIEYTTLMLVATFGLRLIAVTSKVPPQARGIRWLANGFFGVFLLGQFVPVTWLSQALPYLLFLSLIALLYGLRWLTPAALRGNPLARPLAVAIYVFTLATVHDIALTLDWIRSPMLLSSGAMMFGLLTQGVVLVGEQVRTLTLVERLSGELHQAHESSLRFVPRDFLDRLGRTNVADVERGDSTQEDMAVMFTDLRGFTTLTESWGSEKAFSFINRYLLHMEPTINEHDGFINQYLGDGVMALFPTSVGALRSARAMMAALERFNAQDPDGPVRFGVGISAGPLMLGTIGGTTRLDGGVIGDTVNQASRVEGMTKYYGASVLIDEHALNRLPADERGLIRELDRVVAKGKTSPTRIYELIDVLRGPEREQKVRTLDTFASALKAYRRGDIQQAMKAFKLVADQSPLDLAAHLYVQRCQSLMDRELPSDWNGITMMDKK